MLLRFHGAPILTLIRLFRLCFALAHIADGRGEMISRNGNVFRGFAELATWLAEHLCVESAVLDGEIVDCAATVLRLRR